jgi:hypothetical protein
MSRGRKVAGLVGTIPPVLGVSILGATLGAPLPASAAPAFPTTAAGEAIHPACSANWIVAERVNFTIPGDQTGTQGNVELWYDTCSRYVKSQINPPAISQPGFDANAWVINPNGTRASPSCSATTYNGGCTSPSVPDAGVTHAAEGFVQVNQGQGYDYAWETPAF